MNLFFFLLPNTILIIILPWMNNCQFYFSGCNTEVPHDPCKEMGLHCLEPSLHRGKYFKASFPVICILCSKYGEERLKYCFYILLALITFICRKYHICFFKVRALVKYIFRLFCLRFSRFKVKQNTRHQTIQYMNLVTQYLVFFKFMKI